MSAESMGIEPIKRSVVVSWDQPSAFKRFTAQFAQWWPHKEMSIGGRRIREVVFECEQGGRIFEVHADGTRFRWGTVTEWNPPHRVAFSWHSTRAESDAQLVEVTFTPLSTGTRVDLVSSGWEKLGAAARQAHGGYQLSWGVVMDVFAERRTRMFWMFWLFSFLMDHTKGRQSFVNNALGRMKAGD